MNGINITSDERLQIHGKECPKISFFEYAFAVAVPVAIGLNGIFTIGGLQLFSVLVSAAFIGIVLLMMQVQRQHTHVIQIDEDEYEELLRNYDSDSASINSVRISIARNKFFEHSATGSITYLDKCRNILSRYILETAAFIVKAGRTRIDNLHDETAHESLHGEWEYSLEQSKNTNERLVKAMFLIPDSLSVVIEFGFIGRYVSRFKQVLGIKSIDCICGKDECGCDNHDTNKE